jgi:hypothetical protein
MHTFPYEKPSTYPPMQQLTIEIHRCNNSPPEFLFFPGVCTHYRHAPAVALPPRRTGSPKCMQDPTTNTYCYYLLPLLLPTTTPTPALPPRRTGSPRRMQDPTTTTYCYYLLPLPVTTIYYNYLLPLLLPTTTPTPTLSRPKPCSWKCTAPCTLCASVPVSIPASLCL